MKNKYIQNVCSCGCSVLVIPRGIEMSQLVLRCLVHPKQEHIRVGIKCEEDSLHGWEKVINL